MAVLCYDEFRLVHVHHLVPIGSFYYLHSEAFKITNHGCRLHVRQIQYAGTIQFEWKVSNVQTSLEKQLEIVFEVERVSIHVLTKLNT